MASITIIGALGWGANKLVVAEGDGIGGIPEVVSAVALSRNTVKVTFDREMSFLGRTLNPDSYYIEDLLFNRHLFVIRVEQISDTEVRLITQDHEPINYQVTVTGVQDKFGNYIGGVNNIATYAAINPSTEFPIADKTYTFLGLYAGMQSSEETEITPDGDPPYLTDQDPFPGQIEVLKNKIISFVVNDDDLGVRLNLTRVYIEGFLAYDGALGTFLAPYNGAGSAIVGTPAAYTFIIQKTSNWASYTNIPIRVVSADLSPIPNYLDESYSFTSEDYTAPILTDNWPTGINQPKTTNISFTLKDIGGSGVDASSINCTISGVPAITNGIFVAPYNGVGSSITSNAFDGFDVVIDPTSDFNTFQNVVVNANFKDNEGVSGSGGWTFKIVDFLGPLITPLDPINGQLGVSRDTNIQVRITDEQSIVPGTLIEIDINGAGFQTAYQHGVGFSPGWDGPASHEAVGMGIIQVTIDPVSDLPFAADITVRITASDPDGNPERLA